MNKEEIEKMSEEERLYQLEWSDTHEFGTSYAYYLLEENKRLKEQYAFLSEKYELLYNLKKQEVEENEYVKKIEVKSKETLLQERIDKAIEYIKENSDLVKVDSKKHFDFYYRQMKDVTELLEILKGEENE